MFEILSCSTCSYYIYMYMVASEQSVLMVTLIVIRPMIILTTIITITALVNITRTYLHHQFLSAKLPFIQN